MNTKPNIIVISYELIPELHSDILNEIAYYPNMDLLASTDGVGIYNGEIEATQLLMISLDSSHTQSLRDNLAALAFKHDQEAIGFIAADAATTLVMAKSPTAEDFPIIFNGEEEDYAGYSDPVLDEAVLSAEQGQGYYEP